ncbi:MAG: VOC family protein [Myxococcales bacterium]|nr:VOC family protein [Myxococcales bacterium]
MNANKLFPLVITDKLAQTKAFYADRAGFTTTIEQGGYLQVRYGGEDGPELCFMDSQQAGELHQEPFDGRGLIVSIPTDDADQTHARLVERGATPMSIPSDKPWGWRSFGIADPNGVVLDFFHVIPQSAAADATG